MNKSVWVILILLVLLVGGGWLIFNKDDSSGAKATGPIEIGFIGPLTGDAASLGAPSKAAVEVAVDEVNAAGGVGGRQLHVTYEDGQCNAQAATNAASKLINQGGVVAIIGGLCSTETAAFGPMAMQANIPVISYGTSAPSLSQMGALFSRDYPSDAGQGTFGAEYMYNALGARKVAVIYHISDYGTGIKNVFIERFKELGGEIVAEEGAEQTATDYRTQLTKIKAAKPDYIYSPLYPAGATAMFKQAKEMNIATKFLGGDALSDTKLQADVKSLGLNIMFTQIKSDIPAEFNSKIAAKTGGTQVPVYSATAYDVVYLLSNALKTADSGQALGTAIRATNYDGVSGHIQFDQNGDVAGSGYTVYKFENGSATLVE